MLLRRFLHIHPSKFNVYTTTARTYTTDGLRTKQSSVLYLSDNASSPTNTATTGEKPKDVTLFAHVEKAETLMQPEFDFHKSGSKSGLRRRSFVDEKILQWKLRTGHPAAIERAAAFIMYNDPKSFHQLTRDLLLTDNVLRALTISTLSAVLSFFVKAQKHLLDTVALGRIVRRLVSLQQKEDIQTLLLLIEPHILRHLESMPSVKKQSVSYIPPPIIRTSIIFIHALLRVDPNRAISIFQILADAGYIPHAAMVDSSSSESLEQIINMTLVKAGLYWNSYEVSKTILSHLLSHTLDPSPFIIRNTIDVLYTLLSSPSQRSLDDCLSIMRLLHFHARIPDSLIRQFYECTADIDAMSAAEGLYSFSRNPRADIYHPYPPPQGRALSKLMFYSATKTKNAHIVRTLGSEVVRSRLTVPLNDRAKFIGFIARKGIASSARALWEFYASGKDGSLVYGDSALMVLMVNLFNKLAHRLESQEDNSDIEDSEGNLEIGDLEGNSEANDPNSEQLVTSPDDVQSFVHRIMSEFKSHHEPWKDADHRAITSFARACFIVGEYTEGLATFKVLLGRLELPDLHDVNVALGALARESPAAAARALNKMEMHGLQPDSVSLGTVLHHASVQNCEEVVLEIIERVMGTNVLKTDVRLFGALIRALVQPKPDDDRDSRVLKLRTVWKLMHRVQNPHLPVQFGNYLVSLAIEAGDAALAYGFWSALLKERSEYDDIQQRHLRGGIITVAAMQKEREEISAGYLALIYAELNKGGRMLSR